MPAPDWENLGEFFSPDEFAVPVTIRRGDVVLWEGSAIFEEQNGPSSLGDLQHDLTEPHLLLPSADAAAVDDGDVAVVDGKTWDVVSDPEHDGSGLARIRLSKPTKAYRAQF
ncbi:hypothetical protein EU805_01770 [Salipiger sp. IMCC34102]|uniref:head-tail joining protein n=1 Tax=Salipiger sp. IMCC34102 TaxID=2510647 RepID=UPI00101C0F58|nr:hypothetical protein [Salipiger sp. IMCC34102]RYH04124.1 hypothetical protein EU805_01770 [Salipiger sp. IMCC34102]